MKTWVFSTESSGTPSANALEGLTKACQLGGDVSAIHVGEGTASAIAELGAHGAARVFLLDGSVSDAPGIAAALATQIAAESPDLIMFGLDNLDRDVAGRLSSRIGRPVLANATDVTVTDDVVHVSNEILGGTKKVVTQVQGSGPAIVISRPKSFLAEPAGDTSPEVVSLPIPDLGHASSAQLLASRSEPSTGPDLETAEVVVSGGRGVGDPSKFDMIAELAGLLNGAVGATRAVVDAGWVPYSYQVGQTGKTVKPNVYIACGISGAMQHLVGMKDSTTIIAINRDEEAPIFSVADLGVVGDVHEVVPALVNELTKRS